MRSESTESMMPLRLARITAPESRAVTPSIPVPTIGASARSRGTDWRCMLAPIRARLASSCARNGTSEAATETNCFGLTGVDQVTDNFALVVQFDVRLGDGVAVFFPGRKVEGERFEFSRPLLFVFQLGIQLFGFMLLHVIADLVIAVAGIDNAHV